MSRLGLPSISSLLPNGRSDQELLQPSRGLPTLTHAASTTPRLEHPSSAGNLFPPNPDGSSPYGPQGSQDLSSEYQKNSRFLTQLEDFLNNYYGDASGLDPNDSSHWPAVEPEPSRTQPEGTHGYYTNQSGQFYNLRPGESYYPAAGPTDQSSWISPNNPVDDAMRKIQIYD